MMNKTTHKVNDSRIYDFTLVIILWLQRKSLKLWITEFRYHFHLIGFENSNYSYSLSKFIERTIISWVFLNKRFWKNARVLSDFRGILEKVVFVGIFQSDFANNFYLLFSSRGFPFRARKKYNDIFLSEVYHHNPTDRSDISAYPRQQWFPSKIKTCK